MDKKFITGISLLVCMLFLSCKNDIYDPKSIPFNNLNDPIVFLNWTYTDNSNLFDKQQQASQYAMIYDWENHNIFNLQLLDTSMWGSEIATSSNGSEDHYFVNAGKGKLFSINSKSGGVSNEYKVGIAPGQMGNFITSDSYLVICDDYIEEAGVRLTIFDVSNNTIVEDDIYLQNPFEEVVYDDITNTCIFSNLIGGKYVLQRLDLASFNLETIMEIDIDYNIGSLHALDGKIYIGLNRWLINPDETGFIDQNSDPVIVIYSLVEEQIISEQLIPNEKDYYYIRYIFSVMGQPYFIFGENISTDKMIEENRENSKWLYKIYNESVEKVDNNELFGFSYTNIALRSENLFFFNTDEKNKTIIRSYSTKSKTIDSVIEYKHPK